MRYVLALLIVLTSAGLVMAGDIAPSDFAVGYNLQVDKEGIVYSVAIPGGCLSYGAKFRTEGCEDF